MAVSPTSGPSPTPPDPTPSAAGARVPVGAVHLDRVEDWRAAVRASAGILVDLGVADAAYVQACCYSVEQHGPYIVLAPGLALAHAQVAEGRTAAGLALARLAEPVPFGHPANDPVDLVLAFSTPGGDAHIAMIRAFGQALGSGLADRLRAAATEDELTRLLASVTADG